MLNVSNVNIIYNLKFAHLPRSVFFFGDRVSFILTELVFGT